MTSSTRSFSITSSNFITGSGKKILLVSGSLWSPNVGLLQITYKFSNNYTLTQTIFINTTTSHTSFSYNQIITTDDLPLNTNNTLTIQYDNNTIIDYNDYLYVSLIELPI
jgi:hypothetical protein